MTDLLPLVDNQKLISRPNPYATLTRRHQKLRKPPFRLILINPMRDSKRGEGQGNGQAAQAIGSPDYASPVLVPSSIILPPAVLFPRYNS